MVDNARGQEKGKIFSKAYRRAKRALDAGFYLETIVLCDSLLTDRLRLILRSNHEVVAARGTTGSIVNFLLSQKVTCFDENLWADILSWSRMRNKQAHEMGAISDDNLVSWHRRLPSARHVAEAGFDLVNRVSGEARHHRL